MGQPAVRTVLVVEDDEAINALVSRILGDWGYEVRRAADGAEALDAILRDRPDLVLADVMMPRITGIDLVARLRDEGLAVPVVLVSAYDRHRNMPADVPFLPKPFTLAQFADAVRQALGPDAPVGD